MRSWLNLRIPVRYQRLVWVLLISNGFSVALFGLRAFGSDNFRYWFMLWNLILAWIPLIVALFLVARLRKHRWLGWGNILLTILWLGFLPNSFYLITDLIHLQSTGEINILFDTVMFSSFIFNGCVAGFLSVYLVHRSLLGRWVRRHAHALVAGVFFLSGYAIYLGRALRWNTWDMLTQPAGILFDVSEGFINPLSHPQIFVTTITFFALLTAMYAVLYQLIEFIKTSQHR